MKGKLRVSNISIEDKRITIVARKFNIDLTKKTDAVTITTEVSEADTGMYETGWITFDGYVEVSIGIISRLLGESAEYGDTVVTQDELTYSFEAVTTTVKLYDMYSRGIVTYTSYVKGYDRYSVGQTTYVADVKLYDKYSVGSLTV